MFPLCFLLAIGAPIPGDSSRGADLFESQKCVTCHSVGGKGAKTAPDLGKATGRSFTPALMASLMWNHAPRMWPAMESAGIAKPELTEQQAADLYAYFYAFRYFEKPGDAGRGRQVFLGKMCGECHSPSGQGPEGAVPITQWTSVSDPIALAGAMWNHAPRMREAFAKRGIKWSQLSAQEIADLTVYVKNAPGAKTGEEKFSPAEAETGELLFRVKGCGQCHRGSLDLTKRYFGRTQADFAAAMWNHSGKMVQLPPELSPAEMRRIVGYLWSTQYFEPYGNPRKGAKVYASKHCGDCHGDKSWYAPSLVKRAQPLNSISVVSALWRHGPTMQKQMAERKLSWPVFKENELSDLIAYVNSLR